MTTTALEMEGRGNVEEEGTGARAETGGTDVSSAPSCPGVADDDAGAGAAAEEAAAAAEEWADVAATGGGCIKVLRS